MHLPNWFQLAASATHSKLDKLTTELLVVPRHTRNAVVVATLNSTRSSELSDFKPYFKCSNTFENVPTRARLRMRRIFQMHKFLIRSAIKLYGWSDKKLMGTFLWNEVMLSFSIPFANTVYILYFPPHTEINQNTTRQMVELKRRMEISSRTDLRSFFSNLCYF